MLGEVKYSRLKEGEVPVHPDELLQKKEANEEELAKVSAELQQLREEKDRHQKQANDLKAKRTKEENKQKYIIDNRDTDDENVKAELDSLQASIEKSQMEQGTLNKMVNELTPKIEGLGKKEKELQIEGYRLEDQLARNLPIYQLKSTTEELAKRVKENYALYKQKVDESFKLYKRDNWAVGTKLKIEDNHLLKLIQKNKQLVKERNAKNQLVKDNHYQGFIHICEDEYHYEREDSHSVEAFLESLKELEELERQADVSEAEKRKAFLIKALNDQTTKSLLKEYAIEQEEKRKKQEEEERRREQEEERIAKAEQQRKERQEAERQRQQQQRKRREQAIKLKQQQFAKQKQGLSNLIDLCQVIKNNISDLRPKSTDKSNVLYEMFNKNRQQIGGFKQSLQKVSQRLSELIKQGQQTGVEYKRQAQKFEPTLKELQGSLAQFEENMEQIHLSARKKQQEQEQQAFEREQNDKQAEVMPLDLPEDKPQPAVPIFENVLSELNLPPQNERLLRLRQKYLNQLKLLIQLQLLTPAQLQQNGFDLKTYKALLHQKSSLIQSIKMPEEDEKLSIPAQLNVVEGQLAEMEKPLNVSLVNQPYRYPLEQLLRQKEELVVEKFNKDLSDKEREYAEMNKTIEEHKERIIAKREEAARIEEQNERLEREIMKPTEPRKQFLPESELAQVQVQVQCPNLTDLQEIHKQLQDRSRVEEVEARLKEAIQARKSDEEEFKRLKMREKEAKFDLQSQLGLRSQMARSSQLVAQQPRVQELTAEKDALLLKREQLVERRKRMDPNQPQRATSSHICLISSIAE